MMRDEEKERKKRNEKELYQLAELFFDDSKLFLVSKNLEHFSATNGTQAFHSFATIFHFYFFSVLHFSFFFAFHAMSCRYDNFFSHRSISC